MLWFSVACFWCQSLDDVSPYVCSYYFSSVWMATFLEIAAHSVDHMFSLYFVVISRFGFEGWIWVQIAEVPDLCIRFTFIKEFRHRLDFELTLFGRKAKIITF